MLPVTLDTSNENAIAFTSAAQQLSILSDRADRYIAKMDAQDEMYEVDDGDISSSSDDMKENACETIEFYVGLLMKLVPSLERLHKQTLETKQDGNQSLPLPIVTLSQPSLHDPTQNPKSEVLKQTSPDQQASVINEIGPSTKRRSVEKDRVTMLDLRENFAKFGNFLQSKRPSSTGMYCHHYPAKLG